MAGAGTVVLLGGPGSGGREESVGEIGEPGLDLPVAASRIVVGIL